MLLNKTIAVVVPAYNEEKQIGMVIETMPAFVDRIIVVNDCSKDNTSNVVMGFIEKENPSEIEIKRCVRIIEPSRYNEAEMVLNDMNIRESEYFTPSKPDNKENDSCRIILIDHLKNGGVGAAIATGYKWCKDHNIDCTAVMAGDGQMDPAELENICRPVIEEKIDYVKGNRLIHKSAPYVIPRARFMGNSVLSLLTKIASGYWHISDTQTGYTAISLNALNAIQLYKIYKKYGMPNDMLVKLNIAYCTIKEVEIKPIYRVGEKSKMKIWKVIPKVSLLLFRLFIYRLWKKYFFRDFHPLFLLYNMSFLLMVLDIPVIIQIILELVSGKSVTYQSLIVFIFLSISSFQALFFAMWMDIQDNDRLYK